MDNHRLLQEIQMTSTIMTHIFFTHYDIIIYTVIVYTAVFCEIQLTSNTSHGLNS